MTAKKQTKPAKSVKRGELSAAEKDLIRKTLAESTYSGALSHIVTSALKKCGAKVNKRNELR